MTKQIVTDWFNKMPNGERDLPLLIVGSNVYTPRTAYEEVLRGTPLGDQLQALVEKQSFGTSPTDEQKVAKIRLQQILSKDDPNKPKFATLSNKVFTSTQLLDQIQKGTSIGRQWVNNEISVMKKVVAIR
jgi:hypothetical protein